MKRLVLALVLVFSFTIHAHADDASRHAKAKELLSLLHMDRMMQQVMDGMMQQMSATTKQLAGDHPMTPEDQAKIDAFQKKVFDLVFSQVSWKAMEPDYADLYAKNFSDEELDGIIAFYKSPAGLAMVDKLPALTTQAMQLAQTRMAAIQPQLKQMLTDFAKDAPNSGKSSAK